jgi:ATP-dependent RNA helicase SUPV3L1/SUV3
MFPFISRNKTPETPEPAPAPAKAAAAPHPLDGVTGGAFSAATSGERAAKVREWLATNPGAEQLQEVFKELSARDKGAAKAIRERMDEMRRAKGQEAIAAEWAEKADKLLGASKLNIADALAWQRDAAKAGAPLSREPLSALKTQLADRVKTIEDLQHRVQVQREAAVLLAQRVEVLSTKSYKDAQSAEAALATDVQHWQDQAAVLEGDASWGSVEARYPSMLEASKSQLLLVWDAFQSALKQTLAAADDAQAPLPTVPVWADEIRVGRGLPTEVEQAAARAAAAKPAADPQESKRAKQVVQEALNALQAHTAEGHGKGASSAAQQLRAALKQHGKLIDQDLESQVNTALIAAGELEGWQRWSADKVREELLAKAQGLLARPEGQELGGRKLQEALRQLREDWKKADQSGPTNHALWKKFDEACNAAYKHVEVWLAKVREEGAKHRAEREALIAELKAWVEAHKPSTDWKRIQRDLFQFGDRWRASGHVGEKAYAELQEAWKSALHEASAPLHAAQKQSIARREAMVAQAVELAAAPNLNIDAVRELQRQWQTEAQSVPMDRRHEQKLWDAFRKPLDEAFARKTQQRERVQHQLSARDQAVLDASKALEAANHSGDAARIQAALDGLQQALQAQQAPVSAEPAAAAPASAAVPATDKDAAADTTPAEEAAAEDGGGAGGAEVAAPAPAPVPPKPVIAQRSGDDRPGMRRDAPAAAGRTGKPGGDRRDGRDGRDSRGPRSDRGQERRGSDDRFGRGDRMDRAPREDRGPRLGDAAFRAQRDAVEHAQAALRKLATQAHGQALMQMMEAWSKRDAALLPQAQDLGRLASGSRNSWSQAIAAPAAGDGSEAMLRLEMAAEVPTPAEHINARRALQLQLLTRRNDPSPQETWQQDVAKVLATSSDEASARRLQNALKALLKK